MSDPMVEALARRILDLERTVSGLSRTRQVAHSTIAGAPVTDVLTDAMDTADTVSEHDDALAVVDQDAETALDNWLQEQEESHDADDDAHEGHYVGVEALEFANQLNEDLAVANLALETALKDARESLEESGQARGEAAKAVEDAERAAADAADAIRRALEASGLASGAQSTADSAFGKAVDAQARADSADAKAITADEKASSAQSAADAATSASSAASQRALEALGLASTGKVWVQDTAPPKGKWYQWLGAVDNSISVEMDGDSEKRRNLAPDPFNTSPFPVSGSTSAVDSSVRRGSLPNSVKITTATTSWSFVSFAGTAAYPVKPGETLQAGVWVYTREPRRFVKVLRPYAYVGAEDLQPGWTWVTFSQLNSTSGVVTQYPQIGFEGGVIPPAGSTYWVSEPIFAISPNQLSPQDWFGGSTPGDRATDLWINTTGGANTPNRFVNGNWVEVTDKAAKDAAAAAASAAQAAQNAQQTASQADTKAGNAQTAAQSAQSTADTARQTAEQASSDAVSKAAAAEAAAKAHAEAQAEAARLAAIAAASGDASAKADAAKAAAEAAAAADASTKAEAARVAAEAKAAEAKSAADAAKSRADAAHSLAGAARDTAEQAQTTASGKNAILRSTAAPSGTGGTSGDKWERYSTLAAGGKLIGTWAWSGTSWVSTVLDESYLPLVNIGQGTYGDLSGARLIAQSVLADAIASNAVTAVKIAANAVTAVKLAANAVTAEKINAGAVATEKLTALAVTAEKLAAGSVIADKIAANAITAAKIAAGAIDGMVITGALMRTAATGQRLQFDVNGLRAFNSSGQVVASLQSSSGGLALDGILGVKSRLNVGDDSEAQRTTIWRNGMEHYHNNEYQATLYGYLNQVGYASRDFSGMNQMYQSLMHPGKLALDKFIPNVASPEAPGIAARYRRVGLYSDTGRVLVEGRLDEKSPWRTAEFWYNNHIDKTELVVDRVRVKQEAYWDTDERFDMSPSTGYGRIVCTRRGQAVELVFEVYSNFPASGGHTQIATIPQRFRPPSLLESAAERRSGGAWFGAGVAYGSVALFTDGRLFVANTTGAARTDVNGSLTYFL